MFPLFLGRVFLLAFVLVGLHHGLTGRFYLGKAIYDITAASVLGFWLLLLDTIYLYPRLRSPLRKLPLVAVSSDGNLVGTID